MNLQFENNAQELPHLIVIENQKNEDTHEPRTTHTYSGKEYKYLELYNFMKPYARSEPIEEP